MLIHSVLTLLLNAVKHGEPVKERLEIQLEMFVETETVTTAKFSLNPCYL
ncbi:MAG: hypothetical protein QXS14_05300 [Desulfurococcaceae archaeon]